MKVERQEIERLRREVSRLKAERVEEYVRAFAAAWVELEREAGSRRGQLERALVDAERGPRGMERAIEGGSWSEAIKTRLHELENRTAQLKADLAAELRGGLVEILALAATPEAGRAATKNPGRMFPRSQLSVVAGARNRRSHHSTVPI
jgi:hypothetical protein